MVLFTDKGWQFLRDVYEIKQEIETEYQAMLGEEDMKRLRSALTRLLEHADLSEELDGQEKE